jgi:hypothetical protein
LRAKQSYSKSDIEFKAAAERANHGNSRNRMKLGPDRILNPNRILEHHGGKEQAEKQPKKENIDPASESSLNQFVIQIDG